MNRLEDLLNQLEEAQREAVELENSTNIEEIKACASRLKTIKAQIELEKSKGNPNEINNLGDLDGEKVTNLSEIFAKAITGNATDEELSEIKNLMIEGEKNKGGIIVPADIQTRIIELQRNKFDIRKYINVEPVGTNKGSRPLEANKPEASGFASVDEGKDIQLLHEPEFTELEYAIRKYAGYIPITNELLEDTPENFLAFIEKWMAKNELNTFNYQVFNGTGVKAALGILTEIKKSEGVLKNVIQKIDVTPGVKTFKTVINKKLNNLASNNICIFTNSDGYDFIDGLEDKKGTPYLQEDVTKSSGYKFIGKEMVQVPDEFLANIQDSGTERVPFIMGDLNLLYTIFNRKNMSIESTKIGGEAWRKDQTEVKGVFRFDGKLVDIGAIYVLLVDKTKLV